jgi:queuine tRNA-ribosyltransferase
LDATAALANIRSMPVPHFDLLLTDPHTAARRGRLRTRHGLIETPIP